MAKRIITTEFAEEDVKIENHLRPQLLKDYIGQQKVKETLSIYIEAARQREEPLDHVLFYGPPGLGKTTLAGIIANEMGVKMKVTSGPAIEKPMLIIYFNSIFECTPFTCITIWRANEQSTVIRYKINVSIGGFNGYSQLLR